MEEKILFHRHFKEMAELTVHVNKRQAGDAVFC